MDRVEIRDINEDNSAGRPLKNQDLTHLSLSAGEVLSQYGWYLLFGTITVYLLLQHLRKRRTSSRSSDPLPQHDASVVARRQESMEAARRKMQDDLDAKVSAFREKQKQQEEEKRSQKIETWENMKQGKSCRGSPDSSQNSEEAGPSSSRQKPKTDKKPLRSNDYSPLMGQGGGSCSWRPGRRGPSSGG